MNRAATILRWLARLLSAMILALGAILIVLHVFGDEGHASRPLTTSDYIGLAMLLTLLLGLAAAWKWELVGGILILGAYLILAAVNWRVLVTPYLVFPMIAALFLSSWVTRRCLQVAAATGDPAS